MGNAAEPLRSAKQTTLQRTLTTALNELGVDAALVGIYEREGGSLVAQGSRGFSPREVHTILRTLSGQESALLHAATVSGEGESFRAMRLRMITPAAKSLLALPLRHRQKAYGLLVIGRKESAAFSK